MAFLSGPAAERRWPVAPPRALVPRSGAGRAEDLERQSVGVLEGQCGPVVGVDDLAVPDTHVGQPTHPCDEFVAVRAAEGHVVEATPTWREGLVVDALGEGVQAEQGLA